MSDLEIRRFGPDDADDMAAVLELRNAATAEDSPWEPPLLPQAWDAMLRHGWDGEPGTPYLLTAGGRLVGYGTVSTSERDNLHLAWLGVVVHPAHRRRGYGSVLLARMVEEARARGRTSIVLDGWDSAATRGFAAHHGLDVDACVGSVSHGRVKPHRSIFDAALTALGAGPAEAAMVGDSYADDIEGARALGMRAILLDRDGLHVDETDRIDTLFALPAALGLSPP